MGAQVDGAGTEKITIVGSSSLKPYTHRVIPDRIEYGTFLVAGAMMGQDLTLRGGLSDHQTALIDKLVQTGTEIAADNQSTEITLNRPSHITPVNIKTAPYPGFPTDMQAQMMTLLCGAHGTSTISETIFENRFMHVAELGRLGANIRVDGGKAIINGVRQLSGTTVMATDLRASASLILAGLVADGETIIRRIYHLDRGYEHIEDKLRAVGANITRFSE
jgi:UDP-N-acetylglucosamine 1-carboxyvinyltransferase